MSTSVRPRGPLPQRVYWVRRFLVFGIPLVLVVTLARLLGGSSDGADESQATQVSAEKGAADAEASQGPTAPAAQPGRTKQKNKGKKKKDKVEEPVLPAPTGPCLDSDVVATPVVTQVPGGSDVPITFNLRTRESIACTWQASAATMTVTITSGKDRIWSSRECPTAIAPQDVVVYQSVDTPVVATWNARRSDETCSNLTEWALPGWYHVEAAALGGEPSDVQFEVIRPTAPVVTKTVTPKPEPTKPTKNKPTKNKQGKNKHEAGDSGGGTSEPNG